VWALIGRLDAVGGSSSYHRYELIDQFIRRFGEWWAVGTRSTADWGWYLGDTANQYVDIGVTGGLFSLLLFLGIIVVAFSRLGTRRQLEDADEFRIWTFGCALFSHLLAFVGVIYFDATQIAWYALLAVIAAATVQKGPRAQAAIRTPVSRRPQLVGVAARAQ
jgi:hypothetical protein